MSPHERAIRRDLNRTFPEHSFFKERDGVGQESLFNVLKAYSVHDKEVGYCQGSPFMVGLLLMQVRGGVAWGGAREGRSEEGEGQGGGRAGVRGESWGEGGGAGQGLGQWEEQGSGRARSNAPHPSRCQRRKLSVCWCS